MVMVICKECGTGVGVGDYHPRGFCALYNAEVDPYDFIRNAVSNVAPELLEACAAVIRYDETGGREPFREAVDLARAAMKALGED